ncbi:hypothetical protein ACFROC_34900 [Nocardia tengchongensis]|uniref:hypothetical protein n=1 Tax=Nocardia tengchongensis TaxID=2055889 RepID=UPI0036AE8409
MTAPRGNGKAALTQRDAAVLAWLGEVKVAATDSMRQAYAFFGTGEQMPKQNLSRRLTTLTNSGYLGAETLQRGNNRRVYWPAGQQYPIARRILAHDLTVAHLSINLLSAGNAAILTHNRHLPAEIANERRIWTQDATVSAKTHQADGLLWQPNNAAVIVEVELSPKTPARMDSILRSHAERIESASDPVTHVLYLTTRTVGQLIARVWHKNGHAADHPDRMQIIHAVDDTTLGIMPRFAPIAIPA